MSVDREPVGDGGSTAPEDSRPSRYEHGTLASYCHGACRCDACRQANTLYHRELRKRLRDRIGTPHAQVPHGTAGGYANHGCRCRACGNAHRLARADYSRRKSTSRGDDA